MAKAGLRNRKKTPHAVFAMEVTTSVAKINMVISRILLVKLVSNSLTEIIFRCRIRFAAQWGHWTW